MSYLLEFTSKYVNHIIYSRRLKTVPSGFAGCRNVETTSKFPQLYESHHFHRHEGMLNPETNVIPDRSISMEKYDAQAVVNQFQAVVNQFQVEHQPYLKSIMELYTDKHQHSIRRNCSTFEIVSWKIYTQD